MFKKMAISHSFFFPSFSFPGLTQDCLDLSPYESTLFCSAQCSGTLVWRYLDSYVIVGVYGALRLGVSDTPFCDIMCMLGMCCHGEVM